MKSLMYASLYMVVMLVLYSATTYAMAPSLNNGADTRKKMNAATDINAAAAIIVIGFNQFFVRGRADKNASTNEREIMAALKEFVKKWGQSPFEVVRDPEAHRHAAVRSVLEEQNVLERLKAGAFLDK